MIRKEGRFSLSIALETTGIALIALSVSLVNLYLDSESPGFPGVWIQTMLGIGVASWACGVFVMVLSALESFRDRNVVGKVGRRPSVTGSLDGRVVTPRMFLSQVRDVQSQLSEELERIGSRREVRLAWLRSGPYVLFATVTTAVVSLVAVWSNAEYSESAAAQWAPAVPCVFAVVVLVFIVLTSGSVKGLNAEVSRLGRSIRLNSRYEEMLEISARKGFDTFVACKIVNILMLSHLRPLSTEEAETDDPEWFSRFTPPWREKIPVSVFDGMRTIDPLLMDEIEMYEDAYMSVVRAFKEYYASVLETARGLENPKGLNVIPQSIGYKVLAMYRLQSGQVSIPESPRPGATYIGLGDEDEYIGMLLEVVNRDKYSYLWTDHPGIVPARKVKALVDAARDDAEKLVIQIKAMAS
jgi:hypothetical protein